jgi:hypothetical protein
MNARRQSQRWKKTVKLSAPKGFKLLAAFCDAIDSGELPRSAVTLQLQAAFDQILDGKDAKKSLQLQKPTRVKTGLNGLKRPVEIARRFEALRKTGKSVKFAESKTAEEFRVSIPYVQKCRRIAKPIIDNVEIIKHTK